MIRSFANRGTQELFDGVSSKTSRRTCPADLWDVAQRKLDQLHQAQSLGDLRAPPANRLEPLKGVRKGQYSIRINERYRVCFRWTDQGPEDVEIIDYHN